MNTGPLPPLAAQDTQDRGLTAKSMLPYFGAGIAFCAVLIPLSNLAISQAVDFGALKNRVNTIESRVEANAGNMIPRKEHDQAIQQLKEQTSEIRASVIRIETKLGTR